MSTNTEIARTILEQLGGNAFAIMTGAKHFSAGDKCLAFQLPRKAGYVRNGINMVRITLDASDTYTMEFFKFNAKTFALAPKGRVDGLYADALQSVFTAHTGLDTHL